jgi:2,4-dienoyl-CoA reductase-like NADH-dependent reductase (Old Yellow Enzyme family)
MTVDCSPLFAPLTVRGQTLRNRLVLPPMVVLRELTTPEGIAWYGQHARGGVGLVIVEATDTLDFRGHLTAENLRPLVEAIHAGGALAAIQLFPGARGQSTTPADLAAEEVQSLLADYARATTICRQAGFDGVEPHGAHGYLLNQFFSPVQNQRGDGYGGSLAGRMRLATEIARVTREALGAEGLLLYRHSPVGQGYGIAESLELTAALVAAGVDILDLSPSSVSAPGDHAAPFRIHGVPVIAVNGLDEPERAVEALTAGRADLIAIGRGLIADAEWPNKVRAGRMADIVRCIRCDQCHADLSAGVPVTCSQWS